MRKVVAVILLAPALGAWTPYEETSKVHGTKWLGISRFAPEQTYEGSRKFSPEIRIECDAGTTRVFLQFGRVMSGRGQSIAYKVDNRPPRSVWMIYTTNHFGFGLNGGSATAFARQLLGAKELHVRAVPHASGEIEVSFDLDGIDEAVKPIASACKWPVTRPASVKGE